MTEQEVRTTMKAHGWSFLHRLRKNRSYVYAARKVHGLRKEVYIGSLTSLEAMTIDALVEKLTRTHPS